jgi:hypothetical protein
LIIIETTYLVFVVVSLTTLGIMSKRIFITVLSSLLLSLAGFTQEIKFEIVEGDTIFLPRFESERDSLFFYFPETFSRFMGMAQHPAATQAARDLNRHWDAEFGKLNDEQKEILFDMTYVAWSKKFEAAPDLSSFFNLFSRILDEEFITEEQRESLLAVSSRLIQHSDRYKWNQFINRVTSFLNDQALFSSTANSLFVFEPEFTIQWQDAGIAMLESDFETNPRNLPNIKSWTAEKQKLLGAAGSPVIKILPTDMLIVKGRDSLQISGTEGTWYILEDIWQGNNGGIDWQVAGYETESVVTELTTYTMRTNYPEIIAENTLLHYPEKLPKAVEGSFVFRTLRTPEGRLDYPRFTSYADDIELIIRAETDFIYRGGIALKAKELKSSLEPGENAEVRIFRGEELRLRATLDDVVFEDSVVNSTSGRMVIYHEGDSIYHNSIQFRYKPYHSELTLVKDRSAFKHSPFVSSHFKVDIFADMLKWNTADDKIHFQILSGRDVVAAVIESHDYFDIATYNNLGEFYQFNPLLVAVGHAREINNATVSIYDLIAKTGRSKEVIHNAMMNLATANFVEYDTELERITILRKGFHYVLSSRQQKDFDRILIKSITNAGSNVILNIGTSAMDINGVEKFFISEQKGIFIKPKNQSVSIAGNRDIKFDGAMNAGNYEFNGEGIKFSYDEFKVDLPKIDSINLTVAQAQNPNDSIPGPKTAKVNNQLRQTSGSIILDNPKNKSARSGSPEFPAFSSDVGSVIYFSNPEVLGGAYDESLYFEVPPFRIDSANSSDASNMKFDGRFIGGDIIEDFNATVRVQADKSFGFVKELSAEGLAIFNGKAKVYDQLKMSAYGLQSAGNLGIFNGMMASDTFTIYMDSVIANNVKFDLPSYKNGGFSIPPIKGLTQKMLWNTSGDTLSLATDSLTSFSLFADKVKFEGEVDITNRGTFAGGFLKISEGEILSSTMSMGSDFIRADSASLVINSDEIDFPLMRGNNLQATFRNDNNEVVLKPMNEISEILDFPFTEMKTEMAEAVWNIDKNTIDIKSPVGLDGTSRFVASRADGDDLVIDAAGAVYNLNTKKILISGIAKIPVADAYLIPEGGLLSVGDGADIRSFKNATLLLDTINEYHKIVNADVTILSKTRFDGSGFYEYKNEIGKTFNIRFDNFEWRTQKDQRGNPTFSYTFGAGYVNEKDALEISPKVFYKGDVYMYAFKPALEMQGFIKLDLQTFPQNKSWIEYKSDGEMAGIQIDLDKSVTEFGTPVSAGLHFGISNMYGTFISDKKDQFDHDLFKPKGQMSFDTKTNEYIIRDEVAFNSMALAQTYFALNDQTADIRWEGLHNFTEKATPISVTGAGKGKGNLKNNEYSLEAMLHFDLKTPKALLDTLGFSFKSVTESQGLPPALLDRTGISYQVAHLIGEAAANKWEQGSILQATPLYAASEKIASGIVLSNVELRWSADKKAFYSSGPVGISHFNNREINAEAEAYIEIKKSGFGDIVNVLVRLSNNTWAYFRMEDNSLVVYSSIQTANEYLEKNSNLYSAAAGELVFQPGELRDAKAFVEYFFKTYRGSGELPALDMDTAAIKTEKKKSGF